MARAEEVIDEICKKGGEHFFDIYLKPKIMPYTFR